MNGALLCAALLAATRETDLTHIGTMMAFGSATGLSPGEAVEYFGVLHDLGLITDNNGTKFTATPLGKPVVEAFRVKMGL